MTLVWKLCTPGAGRHALSRNPGQDSRSRTNLVGKLCRSVVYNNRGDSWRSKPADPVLLWAADAVISKHNVILCCLPTMSRPWWVQFSRRRRWSWGWHQRNYTKRFETHTNPLQCWSCIRVNFLLSALEGRDTLVLCNLNKQVPWQ